jgi:hypothetical protein
MIRIKFGGQWADLFKYAIDDPGRTERLIRIIALVGIVTAMAVSTTMIMLARLFPGADDLRVRQVLITAFCMSGLRSASE